MTKVTRQGIESIAKYLVITLVLTALVVVLTLFINQRGEQARHNQAVEIASENEGGTGTEQIAVDDQEAETPPNQDTGTPPEELPITGVSISPTSLLAVSMLTFATMSFIMSRRALQRSL